MHFIFCLFMLLSLNPLNHTSTCYIILELIRLLNSDFLSMSLMVSFVLVLLVMSFVLFVMPFLLVMVTTVVFLLRVQLVVSAFVVFFVNFVAFVVFFVKLVTAMVFFVKVFVMAVRRVFHFSVVTVVVTSLG